MIDYALYNGQTKLCDIANVIFGIESTKINTKLVSGQYITQVIGTGASYLDVTLRVKNQQELQSVNQAESVNTLLRVRYKEQDYNGYIESAPDWDPVVYGEVYKAKIRFWIVSV